MAVRSAKLVDWTKPAGAFDAVVYTVPAGVTALVKDVRQRFRAGTGALSTYIVTVGGAQILPIGIQVAVGQTPPENHAPWIVLEPGDTIKVFASSTITAADVVVSGSELDGVAP